MNGSSHTMKGFKQLFKDRSFTFKFTFLSSIHIIVVAASIALLSTQTLEQSVTEATYVRVKRNTSLAALSMSNPYAVYNKALLDSFVDNLSQEKDILYAFVVDYNDGRILVHSDHSMDGQYFEPGEVTKTQIMGSGTDGISELSGIGYEAVSPIRIANDLFDRIIILINLEMFLRIMS